MSNTDPLLEFERLASRLANDVAPAVHVVPQVMRRVRAAEVTSERTLALLAAGSFAAAVVVAVIGFSLLSELADPLGAVFQIVPPIGL